MSGYLQKELVVTTIAGPAGAALEAARAYLRASHALTESLSDGHCVVHFGASHQDYRYGGPIEATASEVDVALELGDGVRVVQDLQIGAHRFPAMLFIVPRDEAKIGMIWKLGSEPYDAIYPDDSFDDEAKRGLFKLCVGLTDALKADGFLLLADDDRFVSLDAAEISADMDKRSLNWALAGVKESFLSVPALRQRLGSKDYSVVYGTTSGLTICDLLHPRSF